MDDECYFDGVATGEDLVDPVFRRDWYKCPCTIATYSDGCSRTSLADIFGSEVINTMAMRSDSVDSTGKPKAPWRKLFLKGLMVCVILVEELMVIFFSDISWTDYSLEYDVVIPVLEGVGKINPVSMTG